MDVWWFSLFLLAAALSLTTYFVSKGGGVVSGFQKMTSQLPVLEKQLENRNVELNSINSNLADKKQEMASLEKRLAKLKKLAKDTLSQPKQEVLAKMEEAKVTEKEIAEIAKLKADLGKKGLDISTLVKLAKEV